MRFSHFCSDVVIDPFAGSGMTYVASLESKRTFVGFELLPEYVAIAQKRIEKILKKK